MLGKTLLNLVRIGPHAFRSQFDPPNASIRRNAAQITQQRMLKSVSPAFVHQLEVETGTLQKGLPGRCDKFLISSPQIDVCTLEGRCH